MSDPKGAGFGFANPKKEGTTISFDSKASQDPRTSGDWTYLEVRVPRVLEQELYDMVIAKIREKGFKK